MTENKAARMLQYLNARIAAGWVYSGAVSAMALMYGLSDAEVPQLRSMYDTQSHNAVIEDIIKDTAYGDFAMPGTPEELADWLRTFLIK